MCQRCGTAWRSNILLQTFLSLARTNMPLFHYAYLVRDVLLIDVTEENFKPRVHLL